MRKRKLAPDPIDVTLGERLRRRRQTLGLARTDLGRRTGITVRSLERYEKGERAVTASDLYHLCLALEIDVAALFKGLTDYPLNDPGHLDRNMDSLETQRFLKAFLGVDDPGLRKEIVTLIKTIADD